MISEGKTTGMSSEETGKEPFVQTGPVEVPENVVNLMSKCRLAYPWEHYTAELVLEYGGVKPQVTDCNAFYGISETLHIDSQFIKDKEREFAEQAKIYKKKVAIVTEKVHESLFYGQYPNSRYQLCIEKLPPKNKPLEFIQEDDLKIVFSSDEGKAVMWKDIAIQIPRISDEEISCVQALPEKVNPNSSFVRKLYELNSESLKKSDPEKQVGFGKQQKLQPLSLFLPSSLDELSDVESNGGKNTTVIDDEQPCSSKSVKNVQTKQLVKNSYSTINPCSADKLDKPGVKKVSKIDESKNKNLDSIKHTTKAKKPAGPRKRKESESTRKEKDFSKKNSAPLISMPCLTDLDSLSFLSEETPIIKRKPGPKSKTQRKQVATPKQKTEQKQETKRNTDKLKAGKKTGLNRLEQEDKSVPLASMNPEVESKPLSSMIPKGVPKPHSSMNTEGELKSKDWERVKKIPAYLEETIEPENTNEIMKVSFTSVLKQPKVFPVKSNKRVSFSDVVSTVEIERRKKKTLSESSSDYEDMPVLTSEIEDLSYRETSQSPTLPVDLNRHTNDFQNKDSTFTLELPSPSEVETPVVFVQKRKRGRPKLSEIEKERRRLKALNDPKRPRTRKYEKKNTNITNGDSGSDASPSPTKKSKVELHETYNSSSSPGHESSSDEVEEISASSSKDRLEKPAGGDGKDDNASSDDDVISLFADDEDLLMDL